MFSLWLSLTLVTLVCAKNYQGNTRYQHFRVNYDVELLNDEAIYQIDKSDSILIIGDQHLVFESKHKIDLGQLVVMNDPSQFIGRITSVNGTRKDNITVYVADLYQETLIKEGKIQIGSTDANSKIPFCFGFNTESTCQHPKDTINLFNNEILRVDCDDCFSAVGGDLFMNLEFSNYRLKTMSFGLKQLHLRGGLGVTTDGQDRLSYVYDKIFPIINKQKILSFNIGFISFALYLDLPVEVDFRADSSIHDQIKYGVDVDVNLGDLYLEYLKGQWHVVKSTPTTSIQPYLSAVTTVDGHARFAVSPMVSLYSPGLFHLNLHFDPSADLVLSGSTQRKDVCLDGQYQTNLIFNGDILKEPINDVIIYDTGIRHIIHQCFPIQSHT